MGGLDQQKKQEGKLSDVERSLMNCFQIGLQFERGLMISEMTLCERFPLPQPLSEAATIYIRDEVWLIGGRNVILENDRERMFPQTVAKSEEMNTSIFVLSLKTWKWREMKNVLKDGRYGCSAVVLRRKVEFVEQKVSHQPKGAKKEKKGKWTEVEKSPKKRNKRRILHEEVLLIVGGYNAKKEPQKDIGFKFNEEGKLVECVVPQRIHEDTMGGTRLVEQGNTLYCYQSDAYPHNADESLLFFQKMDLEQPQLGWKRTPCFDADGYSVLPTCGFAKVGNKLMVKSGRWFGGCCCLEDFYPEGKVFYCEKGKWSPVVRIDDPNDRFELLGIGNQAIEVGGLDRDFLKKSVVKVVEGAKHVQVNLPIALTDMMCVLITNK